MGALCHCRITPGIQVHQKCVYQTTPNTLSDASNTGNQQKPVRVRRFVVTHGSTPLPGIRSERISESKTMPLQGLHCIQAVTESKGA